jgi:DNA replication protein DnaC
MVEICSVCEGSGLRIVQEDGRQVARPCECRIRRRQDRAFGHSGIPKRYEHCSLENYETNFAGADHTLWTAHMRARKFVEGYPFETSDTGLMFVGSVGVGKTHLAVGVLRGLITERGATGLFCDYRDLLKQVQDSYNPGVAATEMGVLRPVFEAEILVLDELGASKPSEWVWDTVAHILNTRYNERRTTIITTNFADEAPRGSGVLFPTNGAVESEPNTDEGKAARAAMRKETLGDRIGERMRSRLHEMCVWVEVYGADLRQSVKRASFASEAEQAITTPALRSAVEALRSATGEGVPNLSHVIRNRSKPTRDGSKTIQDGAAEELAAGRTRLDERVTAIPESEEEKPVVGRARMGKWAAPFQDRINKNDK